jgi:hypothetical protein
LLDWHKQKVELSDANEKLVKHIVAFSGVSKEATELGVTLSDKAFKGRVKSDTIITSAVALATIVGDQDK